MKRSSTLAGCHALAALAFAVSLAPHAAASVTFPGQLQQRLGLAQIPYGPLGCQLCHKDDVGGYQTAIKPFGRAMLTAGTMGGSVPSMLSALSTLEQTGTDSDRDGVPDIAELQAGTDPNVAEVVDGEPPPAPIEDVPLPQTGCTLSPVSSSFDAVASALGAALGLLLTKLRRRSR